MDTAHEEALRALAEVIDPELGLDVVALGLVHALFVDASSVSVTLGLTSPVCPLGEVMRKDAAYRLRLAFPSREVVVALAPEIPWSPTLMSREARRLLGVEDPA